MALNRIGDQVRNQLGDSIRGIFSLEPASPPNKKDKRDPSSSVGQTRAGSPSLKTPFSNQQLQWMGQAVAASNEAVLKIFGEHVEQRFQSVEAEVTTNSEKINELVQEVHRLRAVTKELEDLQLKAKIEAVDAKICGTEQRLAEIAASPSQPDTPPSDLTRLKERIDASAASDDTPYEQRTVAVCGNLGRDCTAVQVECHCKELLNEIGIKDEAVLGVAALVKNDNGSMCEIVFDTPDTLALARVKVKALRKQIKQGHTVWLDAKKSRNETRPNRMVHRIAQHVEMLESEAGLNRKVVKNTLMRSVKLDNAVIGHATHARWVWTEVAAEKLSREQLDRAEAFATQQ